MLASNKQSGFSAMLTALTGLCKSMMCETVAEVLAQKVKQGQYTLMKLWDRLSDIIRVTADAIR